METLDVVAADGSHLVAERIGSAGPAVLLVHGSGGGLHSLRAVADSLCNEGYDPWLVARRAHGPSQAVSRPNSFEQEVDDVRRVLDRMPPAHVVGASYGALVVLRLARDHPSSIRSVAAWEPPLYAAGPHIRGVLVRHATLVTDGEFGEADLLRMEEVARVPQAVIDAARAQSTQREIPDASARATAAGWTNDLEALAGAESDPQQWSNTTVPTLLMQGSETWDPMPAHLDGLAEHLGTAARVVLEGQMHFAPSTAPDLVARELATFWQSLP